MTHDVTRFLLLRGLGAVYAVAFAIWFVQAPFLVGAEGLTPLARALSAPTAELLARHPTLFWLDSSDAALRVVGVVGVLGSLGVALGVTNAAVMATLWGLYLSVTVGGQAWYGFGWEMLLCEAGFLAIFLAPWGTLGPRGLPAAASVPIWLFRWLVFRLMLGAGLIKLRGDDCWRELTCLGWHFETQPNPHPLSWFFHHLPGPVLQGGVAFNHLVELVAVWFVFGPTRLRRWAGALLAAFQILLIASGNLAWLNWLSLVLGFAVLDDGAWSRVVPRLRPWLRVAPPRPGLLRRAALLVLLLFVAWRSVPVVENLAAEAQAMNRSYGPFKLVNTYGMFGSVGEVRWEAEIQGTADDPARPDATWRAYDLPCKPGPVGRAPCLVTPWHPHLDWQMWFVPLRGVEGHPWLVHLVAKLLRGEPAARAQFVAPPFSAAPPRAIRVARYRYRFTDDLADGWWTRSEEGTYLRAVTLDDPALTAFLRRRGW